MKVPSEMTVAEMLAEYNDLTGKRTKRFASRAAGEKQLSIARTEHAKTKPTKAKPKVEGAAKPKTHEERSAAIAASWKNPVIRAKRAERTAVTVVGHGQFKSTSAAMRELKLPMKKLIAFRMHLKEEGRATFEHNGKKIQFIVIN